MNTKKLKRRITAELEDVNRAVVLLKKEPRPEELEGFGDNTPLSEEIDAILSNENEELRADRLGRLLDRAAALDQALHRIDGGTYGTCITCGREISAERLDAVPEAAYCTRCQADRELPLSYKEHHGGEWKLSERAYKDRKEFREVSAGEAAESADEETATKAW